MDVTASISYSGILSETRKQLSLLAKRARAKDGDGLYDAVSFSGEESSAFKSYIDQGVNVVVSELPEFVKVLSKTASVITLTVSNVRGFRYEDDSVSDFKDAFTSALENYLVSYSLYEYLSLTQSAVAQKFVNDASLRLQSVKEVVLHKSTPPESGKDYEDISGSITSA